MPLRAATLSDTISAFVYARDQGARVINFSAGFPFYSQALKDTIDNIGTVLVVNAADNGGFDGHGDNSDRVADFPCKFNSANLICVAASNQRDKLTTFSNFGPSSVDLAAPGENVLGAYPPHAISYDLNEFFDEPLGTRFRRGGHNDSWGLTSKLGGSLTDSPKGDYRNNTNSSVTTRPIDLRQRRSCEVDFFPPCAGSRPGPTGRWSRQTGAGPLAPAAQLHRRRQGRLSLHQAAGHFQRRPAGAGPLPAADQRQRQPRRCLS